MVWTNGVPSTEWRTRDVALFAESEWGWSRDGGKAFVFPLYELPLVPSPDDYARSAAFHVQELKRGGEKNWVCASVHGALAMEARSKRAATAEAVVLASGADPVAAVPVSSSVPVRAGGKIQERIRSSRRGRDRRGASIEPAEVFEREERRHLA